MRQITDDSVRAFRNHENFSRGNSRVTTGMCYTAYYLHGKRIAVQERSKTYPVLTDCGWDTPTTRDRLNAILRRYGWYLYQSGGQTYLASWRHHDERPWRGRVDVADLAELDRTIEAERDARKAA